MEASLLLPLTEHFAHLEEPRVERTTVHPLLDIVVIAVCAVIAGAESWDDSALFGETKAAWFATFLALPNGIPSHDTCNRVFAALDPEQFRAGFAAWAPASPLGRRLRRLGAGFAAWAPAVAQVLPAQVIAVDGKTVRGKTVRGKTVRGKTVRGAQDRFQGKSAIHLVSPPGQSTWSVHLVSPPGQSTWSVHLVSPPGQCVGEPQSGGARAGESGRPIQCDHRHPGTRAGLGARRLQRHARRDGVPARDCPTALRPGGRVGVGAQGQPTGSVRGGGRMLYARRCDRLCGRAARLAGDAQQAAWAQRSAPAYRHRRPGASGLVASRAALARLRGAGPCPG
jgi:DDE_Tnp_1-associated/GETHR pentapeptide repeat (5 copies)